MGQDHDVRGSIWSHAIAQCLAENGSIYIPKMDAPIYIDRPIVLQSGNKLVVHPETEIRLKVGAVGTCMVRNAQIVLSQDSPVQLCEGADEDILVEGGIWCDQNNEGRGRGGEYDQQATVPGSMSTFLFHNITRVACAMRSFGIVPPLPCNLAMPSTTLSKTSHLMKQPMVFILKDHRRGGLSVTFMAKQPTTPLP